MGCFYPLRGTQLHGGEILFHKRTPGMPIPKTNPALGRDINLPCGRCTGCKINRAQTWAIRCLHESQQHTENSFLTLTISDPETKSVQLESSNGSAFGLGRRKLIQPLRHQDEWPSTETLSKRTHKLFVKRLRKSVGQIRYYMCGEYGEKLARPHYHYLIFGHSFPDKKYSHTSKSGEKLYTSESLSKIWPYGKAWIGDVTYESCAYVAAYVMKKLNGNLADNHYQRTDEAGCAYWLEPEFNEMSRRPGIGRTWWEKFHPDVINEDVVIKKGGGKIRPPRYYDKLLELFDPAQLALIKFKREMRGKELIDDNTPARLADKERVAQAKLKLKKRNLEQS